MDFLPFGYDAKFEARSNTPMKFNQIRYFLAVADTLNFTNAAEACAVSQPALSKAIRYLEETLGGELFSRNAQRVELTEFGRTMRVHFERIEDNRRKALEAAKLDQRFQVLDLFGETMVVAFASGHRFGDFDEVSLTEIVKEPYLDRLHCEFRDDFLAFTKGSGLELDVVMRSERED